LAKAGSIPLPVSILLDEVGGEAGSYQRRFGKARPAIGLPRGWGKGRPLPADGPSPCWYQWYQLYDCMGAL